MARGKQPHVRLLRMGQILRDARPKSPLPEQIGSYVNLYAATHTTGGKLVPFESGINSLAAVAGPEGDRRPVILVASSPHKIGMVETPWQDIFDGDNGYVR